MTENVHSTALPAFDAAVLVRLASVADDGTFALAFARCYRQMLAGRVRRISHALFADDVEVALDATLSLKVSSSTVGTAELADLAGVIEANVRRLDVAAARVAAMRLPSAAARADEALVAYLRD